MMESREMRESEKASKGFCPLCSFLPSIHDAERGKNMTKGESVRFEKRSWLVEINRDVLGKKSEIVVCG